MHLIQGEKKKRNGAGNDGTLILNHNEGTRVVRLVYRQQF